MKELFAGVALVFVIGIAAFAYRNAVEQPRVVGQEPVACTLEAKLCPDGTSVGRSGPSCAFAACPLPNVEFPLSGIALVLPDGYVLDGTTAFDEGTFVKASASINPQHTITVRRYLIPEGETAESVMLAHTRYQPSDLQAEDTERFENVIVNGTTFRATVIERFEGHVTSAYYLLREKDVIAFQIAERDVTGWTDPELVVADLPEHQALLRMLATVTGVR